MRGLSGSRLGYRALSQPAVLASPDLLIHPYSETPEFHQAHACLHCEIFKKPATTSAAAGSATARHFPQTPHMIACNALNASLQIYVFYASNVPRKRFASASALSIHPTRRVDPHHPKNGRFSFQTRRRQGLLRWRQRQTGMGRVQHAGLAADAGGERFALPRVALPPAFFAGCPQLHRGLRCEHLVLRGLRRPRGPRGVGVLREAPAGFRQGHGGLQGGGPGEGAGRRLPWIRCHADPGGRHRAAEANIPGKAT